MLLEPKQIQVSGAEGKTRTFVISKLPYGSAGREILSQFIPTATPKVGNYADNHALMLKMLSYVAVIKEDGTEQLLNTQALVDNHVTDFQMGVTLEKEMLEYNVGFFVRGSLSVFLDELKARLPQWTSGMLMAFRAALLAPEKPASTNSEQSIQ